MIGFFFDSGGFLSSASGLFLFTGCLCGYCLLTGTGFTIGAFLIVLIHRTKRFPKTGDFILLRSQRNGFVGRLADLVGSCLDNRFGCRKNRRFLRPHSERLHGIGQFRG